MHLSLASKLLPLIWAHLGLPWVFSAIASDSTDEPLAQAFLPCAGAAAEKVTRGTLKAAVERQLSRERTVIFESINGIKGYRRDLNQPTDERCCKHTFYVQKSSVHRMSP